MSYLKKYSKYAWILGLAAGALFIGVGASCGQLEVIWRKAIMICMECIGLG